MSRSLILDAEAVAALADRRNPRFEEVRAALVAAQRLQRDVIIPTVILAELYRGPQRNHLVDACLSRETGLITRDTDRPLARLVGGTLHLAQAGSEHLADAHCIATAIETGGGVIITGDPDDITRLAAPYPNINVTTI